METKTLTLPTTFYRIEVEDSHDEVWKAGFSTCYEIEKSQTAKRVFDNILNLGAKVSMKLVKS